MIKTFSIVTGLLNDIVLQIYNTNIQFMTDKVDVISS